MPIKQLLFDCDNTLVLSEEVAFEACADLANTILSSYGITERYTSDMLIEQFVGQNFLSMLKRLLQAHKINIPADQVNKYVKSEEAVVISKLAAKAKPCVGVNKVLAQLHAEQKYGLAVASSSTIRRLHVSLEKADQSKFFKANHVFSAVSSLPKPTSKPDPAVYLFAMQQLGVKPEECITVEDSKSGATSACRAKIPTIAYVGAYNGVKKQKEIGDLLLRTGCFTVMYDWSEYPAILAERVAMMERAEAAAAAT